MAPLTNRLMNRPVSCWNLMPAEGAWNGRFFFFLYCRLLSIRAVVTIHTHFSTKSPFIRQRREGLFPFNTVVVGTHIDEIDRIVVLLWL
jgi:hypothetical protein